MYESPGTHSGLNPKEILILLRGICVTHAGIRSYTAAQGAINFGPIGGIRVFGHVTFEIMIHCMKV